MLDIIKVLLCDKFLVAFVLITHVLPLILIILFRTFLLEIVGTIALIAAGIYFKMQRSTNERLAAAAKRFGDDNGAGTGAFIPLTQREEHMLDVPSPTVAIFIETTSVEESVAVLAERVRQIAQANRWLSGRLRSDVTRSGAPPALWVPNESSFGSTPHLAPTQLNVHKVPTRHELVTKRFDDHLFCDVGSAALDQPTEPLVKLNAVVCDYEPKLFALLFGFNHTVFDGGSVSRVLEMALAGAPVVGLDPRRPKAGSGTDKLFFLKSRDLACKFAWFVASASNGILHQQFLPRFITSLVDDYSLGDPQLHYFNVRREWVEEQKKKALLHQHPDCKFVSTNDCLLSWFIAQPSIRDSVAGVGFAVDLRDVPDTQITNETHGNFLDLAILYTHEIQGGGPVAIRKRVADIMQNKPSDHEQHAGVSMPPAGKRRLAMASNHTKFWRKLDLPGCRVVSQFPTGKSWQAYEKVATPLMPFLCITRTSEADICVMIMVHGSIKNWDMTPFNCRTPFTHQFSLGI